MKTRSKKRSRSDKAPPPKRSRSKKKLDGSDYEKDSFLATSDDDEGALDSEDGDYESDNEDVRQPPRSTAHAATPPPRTAPQPPPLGATITCDAVGMRGGAMRPLSPSLLAAIRACARAARPVRDASKLCDMLGLDDATMADSVEAALAVELRDVPIKDGDTVRVFRDGAWRTAEAHGDGADADLRDDGGWSSLVSDVFGGWLYPVHGTFEPKEAPPASEYVGLRSSFREMSMHELQAKLIQRISCNLLTACTILLMTWDLQDADEKEHGRTLHKNDRGFGIGRFGKSTEDVVGSKLAKMLENNVKKLSARDAGAIRTIATNYAHVAAREGWDSDAMCVAWDGTDPRAAGVTEDGVEQDVYLVLGAADDTVRGGIPTSPHAFGDGKARLLSPKLHRRLDAQPGGARTISALEAACPSATRIEACVNVVQRGCPVLQADNRCFSILNEGDDYEGEHGTIKVAHGSFILASFKDYSVVLESHALAWTVSVEA